ncbi:MAG: hypothetical protein VZT48_08035 [Bulleidia sp.]|nr:hypothetical protein [Bulleidia sp.]
MAEENDRIIRCLYGLISNKTISLKGAARIAGISEDSLKAAMKLK